MSKMKLCEVNEENSLFVEALLEFSQQNYNEFRETITNITGLQEIPLMGESRTSFADRMTEYFAKVYEVDL